MHEKVPYFGSLLGIPVVSGWVTGAAPDVQGKNGEKHHVHSALNPSSVAGSRVGSRSMSRVINFIKWQYCEKKGERRLSCVISNL